MKGIWLGVMGGLFCGALSQTSWAVQSVSLSDRVPGQIIVKLRQNKLQGFAIEGLVKELGEKALMDFVPFRTDESLNTVKLADDADLAAAMQLLKEMPEVEYAEPNYRITLFENGMPEDPDFSRSWGLRNVGQADPIGEFGTSGADIRVVPLWNEGIHGSRNVVVAVIDTGMDWEHPDLKGNLFTNPGEAGEKSSNGKDDDGNGFVDDVHGWNFLENNAHSVDASKHGTHCAGVIGAQANNDLGTAGVNWKVSLLPVKFVDEYSGGTVQGAIDAVNYARKMKARVISASWGGRRESIGLKEAIQATADAGILFVAAAGNDGRDNDFVPTYPASFPISNIVSVAATDNRDSLAVFSNYGARQVHVAAPGVEIWSTVPGGGYESMSGTSMATPHVAGIAALLLSSMPELTGQEIKERLIRTSDPVKGLQNKVAAQGRVNAYRAFHDIGHL